MLTPRAYEQFRTANRLARDLHKTLADLVAELRRNDMHDDADDVAEARGNVSDALEMIEDLIDNLPAPQAPDPEYQRMADNGRLILDNGRDVS